MKRRNRYEEPYIYSANLLVSTDTHYAQADYERNKAVPVEKVLFGQVTLSA